MQRQIAPQTILETCRSKESLVARPGSIRSSIRAVSPRGQDPEVTATHSSHPFHSHGIAGDKKSKGKDKFNDTSDPAAVKLTVAKKPKSKKHYKKGIDGRGRGFQICNPTSFRLRLPRRDPPSCMRVPRGAFGSKSKTCTPSACALWLSVVV